MFRNLQLILPLILWTGLSFAQNVEGVIKDSHEAPIVGATIVVKGSQIYAVTDIDGKFSLTPPKSYPYSILASSTGFVQREVQIYEALEEPLEIILVDENVLGEIVVTARRRSETVQEVPIPISVVGGELVEDAGAFNVNRVKELVPSVQLYSSNPRNTTLNIRGLGSTFGLTNDGIDPGVGFYVDGVYYARPAATTLDFIDIEQIEVLRGPQGTLFGKNTTAGAFNVTTRAASFTQGANLEVSYGNYGFVQAKASVTGPLSKKLAARISFSGTQRNGFLTNVANQQSVNDLNNLGFRAQLLYQPNDNLKITLIGDNTHQNPNGYAQVVAGVVTTQRAAYRQFDNIIADLGYSLPSRNPFDRVIDHDTPWKSGSELGGVSLNVEAKIGKGTLTSTSAWRYWNWNPSNDRDFTGLSVLRRSEGTSRHNNWSQEIRYAGDLSPSLSGVIGVFAIGQHLDSGPGQIEESGSAQWRFSQSSTSGRWSTPGLFEGYGVKTNTNLETLGAAVFAQVDWAITEKLHVLPGVRYNYDSKEVDYSRLTYGGLQTEDPELIALKRAVYTDQVFQTEADESNLSGQFTVSYRPIKSINSFATVSTSYKPVGVNLGGLPTSNGEVMLDLAQIKPEYVTHFEGGVKTSPTKSSTLNFVFFHTTVTDFQTQVQSPEVGVNRGYLANAEEVRVMGIELDGNIRFNKNLSLYGAAAFTDGEYVSFTNAPVPLEETGGPAAFKDISGSVLPGISKWSGSIGGEILSNQLKLFGIDSKLFLAVDNYYRSEFSSSPSPSKYLNVDAYYLLNARFGFRATQGLSLFVWGRNILDRDYFEQLLPAGGNAGHYAGVLGDPRTYGVTIRYNY
jgi:iron complex outermembrane recepter protein